MIYEKAGLSRALQSAEEACFFGAVPYLPFGGVQTAIYIRLILKN